MYNVQLKNRTQPCFIRGVVISFFAIRFYKLKQLAFDGKI
jgi:hypothetical protein